MLRLKVAPWHLPFERKREPLRRIAVGPTVTEHVGLHRIEVEACSHELGLFLEAELATARQEMPLQRVASLASMP